MSKHPFTLDGADTDSGEEVQEEQPEEHEEIREPLEDDGDEGGELVDFPEPNPEELNEF